MSFSKVLEEVSIGSYYREVIRVLSSKTEIDYKALAIKLAERNPKLFLELLDGPPSNLWKQDVFSAIINRQNTFAIELLQKNTGKNLRTCRNICNNVRDNLSEMGLDVLPGIGQLMIDPDDIRIVEHIVLFAK